VRKPRPPAPWIYRLAANRPGTVHEMILDELRTVILDGYAPPGTPIQVDDVAARFVASRIPVREALKTLIGEGLVDHRPRAGYAVAQLTPVELVEFYIVREALEAAALTAAVPLATTADDAILADAHAALSRAIESGDSRGHHRESRRFHLALTTPSRMHRLLRMFEAAWNITEPLQPMSHVSRTETDLLHEDHQHMLNSFVARDTEALLAASARHYERLRVIVAALPVDTGLFAPRAR
jgi:DNA-binding GntR family transcriptional regulator